MSITTKSYNELKKIAKDYDIELPASIKKDELIELIEEAIAKEQGISPMQYRAQAEEAKKASKEGLKGQTRSEIIKEATKLKRIVLHNNNSRTKELDGFLVTISNDIVEVTRFIPFEKPWHVEQIIYNHLKARKCQEFRSVKLRDGTEGREAYLKNEFVVEDLKPLTEQELKVLAKQQELSDGRE